jgi:hypothetical protein
MNPRGKSIVPRLIGILSRGSQCPNKPRTLPKSPTKLGNAWAACSRKVHWRRLSECALRGTLKLESERWWMRRADALCLENPMRLFAVGPTSTIIAKSRRTRTRVYFNEIAAGTAEDVP